ncbi:hypothetical protein HPB47_008169 [Ixodes persulcatus]|uniref:Uncharacterized protein n=1 Tax=Ixodes persulcatus TaxID=34615 RepID=A0AC60P5V8_IXOPE|nr:hypothetical protein HPB47_008169 [Ixodes persulcatus]
MGTRVERPCQGQVVVICASPDTVREIMLTAADLGMDNGDFVFFSVELFTTRNTSNTRPWYRESDTAERNSRARRAYEALLVVQTRIPESSEFAKFKNALHEAARREFDFEYSTDELCAKVQSGAKVYGAPERVPKCIAATSDGAPPH